jgi:hypothetical protein
MILKKYFFFIIFIFFFTIPAFLLAQITSDLNLDGKVDVFDLLALLNKWGTSDSTAVSTLMI